MADIKTPTLKPVIADINQDGLQDQVELKQNDQGVTGVSVALGKADGGFENAKDLQTPLNKFQPGFRASLMTYDAKAQALKILGRVEGKTTVINVNAQDLSAKAEQDRQIANASLPTLDKQTEKFLQTTGLSEDMQIGLGGLVSHKGNVNSNPVLGRRDFGAGGGGVSESLDGLGTQGRQPKADYGNFGRKGEGSIGSLGVKSDAVLPQHSYHVAVQLEKANVLMLGAYSELQNKLEDHTLRGKVTFRFEVNSRGKAENFQVLLNSLNVAPEDASALRTFESAIGESIGKLNFPLPKEGTDRYLMPQFSYVFAHG